MELKTGSKGEPRCFKPNTEELNKLAMLMQKHSLGKSSLYKSISVDKETTEEEAPPGQVLDERVLRLLETPLDIISQQVLWPIPKFDNTGNFLTRLSFLLSEQFPNIAPARRPPVL